MQLARLSLKHHGLETYGEVEVQIGFPWRGITRGLPKFKLRTLHVNIRLLRLRVCFHCGIYSLLTATDVAPPPNIGAFALENPAKLLIPDRRAHADGLSGYRREFHT
jgi:hypothetical protein